MLDPPDPGHVLIDVPEAAVARRSPGTCSDSWSEIRFVTLTAGVELEFGQLDLRAEELRSGRCLVGDSGVEPSAMVATAKVRRIRVRATLSTDGSPLAPLSTPSTC